MTNLQHIAVNYKDKQKADTFFTKVLNLNLIKSFTLNSNLTKQIFNIFQQVDVLVYGNNHTIFEVFITHKDIIHIFDHICIKVNNRKEFINRCKKYGLKPFQIKKEEKKLLFVKDFSGNLFEIV